MQEARGLGYPVVVADAGDFVSGPSDTLQAAIADLMSRSLEQIRYDALAVGEMELTLDPGILKEIAGRLPLVAGNIRFSASWGADVPPIRYVDVPGGRVAVTSFLDPVLYYAQPAVFENPGPVSLVEDPVDALTPLIERARREADLVVVLAHADRPEIEDFLSRAPRVDVVVQGHAPRGDGALRKLQGAFLVVPWHRARAVSLLSLTRTGEAGLTEDGFRMWFLQTLKEGDGGLEAMVHDFQVAHGLIK